MRHLVMASELTHREKPIRETGSLERYDRPLPVLMITMGCSGR